MYSTASIVRVRFSKANPSGRADITYGSTKLLIRSADILTIISFSPHPAVYLPAANIITVICHV